MSIAKLLAAGLVVSGLLLVACERADPVASVEQPGAAAPTPLLPDGWRWEVFGDVQVAVPGDFGRTGSQRLYQWCVGDGDLRHDPVVVRPGGAQTEVACGGPQHDAQVARELVENTGEVVGFEIDDPGSWVPGLRRDRETVLVAGTAVLVQVAEPLRSQIVATIHEVRGDDVFGCSAEPRRGAQWQRPPIDLPPAERVTAVTVCRYELLGDDFARWESRRLEGRDAERLARELAAPSDRLSTQCYEHRGRGRTSVRVEHAAGTSEVSVRGHVCLAADDGSAPPSS